MQSTEAFTYTGQPPGHALTTTNATNNGSAGINCWYELCSVLATAPPQLLSQL